MTKREIILARNALRALEGAGPAGLGREALTEQAGTFAETILSRAELRLQHGEPPANAAIAANILTFSLQKPNTPAEDGHKKGATGTRLRP